MSEEEIKLLNSIYYRLDDETELSKEESNLLLKFIKMNGKEIERLNKNIQATRNCILKDISILKTRNDISQEEMITRLKATLIILGSDKE